MLALRHLQFNLHLSLRPPAEFSRESLLEAAGGLECPLTKEGEYRSGVASVADPSTQQNNAQPGRVRGGLFPQWNSSSPPPVHQAGFVRSVNSSTGLTPHHVIMACQQTSAKLALMQSSESG